MKKLLFLSFALTFAFNLFAQTDLEKLAELKADLATKQATADAAVAEANAVKAAIEALPGWRKGAVGILGASFSGSRQWFANAVPNSSSNGVSFALTGFAHNIQDKYFWRNNGQLNLAALRFQEQDADGNDVGAEQNLQFTTDALQLTSLYGYRLNDKIAISALGEYRTVVIGGDETDEKPGTGFNNPGYLDLGAGVTWTPIANLVAVFHPLNYNFIFSNNDLAFTSSLGAKYVVDYTRSLPMGVAWTSNLTGFFSYKSNDPSLHNFTWTNGVSFTAWKGIGVSAQLGLRSSEQEALLVGNQPVGENPLQSYYVIGLSYSL
ncbi:MAG: DUF3078 domain-containing protein [Saprospiraceae bacterium]